MRITSIQLENIKSYRHETIYLHRGTTAIRGHNGAGKSTLVEAIGFALFDALSYDQAQFVREGEKYGTVTIGFLSALDDREYQVVRRCGSGAVWFVFDPDLQGRIAEQKVDVTDFLKKHFRLEPDVSLKDLFNDAIGVPQGTFTADFLMTATNRKKKFDALLRVEEYRKAAEKLADTRGYLQEQQRTQERKIADLERETGQLEAWQAEVERLRQEETRLTARLAQIERDAATVEARRETLRQHEALVTKQENVVRVAAIEQSTAQEQLSQASTRLSEAREAARIRQETAADHQAHIAARQQSTELQERLRARDAALREQTQIAQQLERATTSLRHTRERLEQAQRAEQRIAELAPAALHQVDLERASDEARQRSTRLDELQRAQIRTTKEREQVEKDLAECQRRIAELERLRPEAVLLDERREKVAQLQDLRARCTERQKRQRAIAAEREQVARQRTKAAQSEAKERENVRKLLDSREIAEQVPALEAHHETLQAELRQIEARQEHYRFSRQQSGAGNCPFLHERCQNIQTRGENSLATYFDKLIEQDEHALAPLRVEFAQQEAELTHARKVRSYYERLGEYQERLRQAQEVLAASDEQLARLEAERAEIEELLSASPDERELADAQSLFKRSDDADKQLREIAPRQAEAKRLHSRREQLDQEQQTIQREAAALASAPEDFRAAQAELAALGDPRREVASLEGRARERAPLEIEAASLERTLADLNVQAAQAHAALLPFATLDDDLRAVSERLRRTQDGYTRYLQYEQSAARLPDCEEQMSHAEKAAKTATETHIRAVAELEAAKAGFDLDELKRLDAQAHALSSERGGVTQGLRDTQQRSKEKNADIARVQALAGDLQAAHDEYEELRDTERMLQQFRETIKEAGPNIMKALLRQISTEANRIFGEILGDRGAQLAWENDYEIVLRRDGKERSFAQLSGGEQMSAALAVRLALLRNLTRLDLAFFDEPTQNMDDERRVNLAEQIRRVRGFEQLVIISHDDTFEQGLDSVIHLEKRQGQTILVEEDALVSV